jgi:hypothetical protein
MFKFSLKTHKEAFQCQITFLIIKTMYGTHIVIIDNKHLVCFHWKKKQINKIKIGVHNQSKQGVHYNSNK